MKVKPHARPTARAEPQKRSLIGLWDGDWQTLACSGYTSLDQNPEILTAVDTIARLVGSMTIHLMHNTDKGDERVKNGLSRLVDIEPNRFQGRSNFIAWVVKTMLLTGDGNCVVYPVTKNGYLEELRPIPAHQVSFLQDGYGYQVSILGKAYDPASVLHFVSNPDSDRPWMGAGYRVALRDVAGNLKQAAATTKGFMESKWKPSLVIRVEAMNELFGNEEGRKRMLEEYIGSGDAGAPWVVPAELFEVQQVKPLTLKDLAISETVALDKKTVASILGVPPFVLGVGEFVKGAWINFINTRIMPLAQVIQQELTRKLLYGEDWYFRFNPMSLYSYSLQELVSATTPLLDRMALTRNEARDLVGFAPMEGGDQLLALENYVPADRLGDQKKLLQGGDEDDEKQSQKHKESGTDPDHE